jgi:hypothetical protein
MTIFCFEKLASHTMQSPMWFIAERFLLHLLAAIGVYLIGWFAAAHFLKWKCSRVVRWILPAFVILGAVASNEFLDLAKYNDVRKTAFDVISWTLGASVAAYGLYRFRVAPAKLPEYRKQNTRSRQSDPTSILNSVSWFGEK